MRVLLDECLPNLDALLKKTTDEASPPAQSARRAGNTGSSPSELLHKPWT